MISILEPVRKPSWSMDIGTSNSKRKLPIRISMFWRWLLWRSSRRFTSRTRWEVKRLVSFIKSTTVPFCPLTVSLGRCLTVTNSGWGNYTLKYLLNDPDQRPSFVFSSHPDLSSISMLRKLDIRQLSCKCFIFSSATQPALLTLKSKLSVHEQECKSEPLIPSTCAAMLIKASQCCIQIHWQSGNMRLHKHWKSTKCQSSDCHEGMSQFVEVYSDYWGEGGG